MIRGIWFYLLITLTHALAACLAHSGVHWGLSILAGVAALLFVVACAMSGGRS